tara:strand:+ start:243 stop:527 length:285 start_codon:yes stop_codon:yes gene_type:complete
MYSDLDEWFDDVPHPHDTMPIATDKNEFPAELMEVPTSIEPISYASRHESTPDFEKEAEEIVTMHEKAYRIATAKYNPFSIGGSENIHDFDRKD